METRNVTLQRSPRSFVKKIPESVAKNVEHFFYSVGFSIAKKPYKWIIICLLPVLVCLAGFARFRQEKNPLNLWVPPDSDFVRDTEWLMSNFKEGQRVQQLILTADNVLEPKVLLKLNDITNKIATVRSTQKFNVSWNDVCFKVPIIQNPELRAHRKRQVFEDDFFEEEPATKLNKSNFDPVVYASPEIYCKVFNSFPRGCLLLSILDIWGFNSSKIEQLKLNDVIRQINSIDVSPTMGHTFNFSELLGEVTRNDQNQIISAKAIQTHWMVHVNFSQVNMDKIGNNAGTADWATENILEWESLFLEELEKYSKNLSDGENEENISLWYVAGRSFGDISNSILFQDIDKVFVGVVVMSIYVQIILSNYNIVEWRFLLTMFALFCIGSAFIVAVGACSLIGIPYGPVHTSLPFLLMGLGVDDTFIMMASWQQILSIEKNRQKSLEEKVGMMLSHAGAAICITSLTDVVAFVIGASTILPSLQSYCIYAAVGVFVTFLLQITFFVAVFTLDAKRIESSRNCLIPCIIHKDFQETHKTKKRPRLWKTLDFIYSRIILTVPAKVFVVLLTLIFAGFGAYGSYYLEQWFDPVWFLPKDSYLSNYLIASQKEYPHHGHPANIFIGGEVNYTADFNKILHLTQKFEKLKTIESIKSWPSNFVEFVQNNYAQNITLNPLPDTKFRYYLAKFLYSRSGGKYQGNFRFLGNLTCGKITPPIQISSIDFTFTRLSGPNEWIPAMDEAKKITAEAEIQGFVFVWSKMFGTWVTDKVIAQEVLRNLILALICVMGTTSFLIAEIQTCSWILLCVLLTLLDVCGFMYFWGFTIDIVSCISLELAVGLSVDYAAHVAHAFLVAPSRNDKDKDRQHRAVIAVRHIGAAVMYGAGSTLLALSLLIFSKAYVFQVFFKTFLLVILFGLWHGLIMLPVMLSTIGPSSLQANDESHARELESLSANVTLTNGTAEEDKD